MGAYRLQGSTASLAPMAQNWIDIVMGIDHNGAPLYSKYKLIELEFDECSLPLYKQWADLVATGTSLVTLTILDQASLNYTALSGVFLDYRQRPKIQAGNVSQWSLIVSNVIT